MKKMKLILNESLISNKDSDIIEDTSVQAQPDYQIIDVTVIPDEDYYPTVQAILIDLDEDGALLESDGNKLDINILSETVNQKTNYSNSLFEFESANHTITLSLVLQETDRRGIYKVEAYTTRGVKVFESNTYKPKYVIESYLNSLANEYLIDKPLKESEEGADLLTKYKLNGDEKFRYSMLGRLQSDCKYVLGAGDGDTRHLWAVDDPKKHCAIMRALYNSFKEKPDWITLEDIDNYEEKLLSLVDDSLKESYSLGDDKASFDEWEKQEEKLKKVYDYVTAGNREDLKAVMDTVEHSQDNIYTADVTIKGLKEDDLDKEDKLSELYNRYPFINNIQISKWYGDEIVCFIDFDISGAASDRRLDVVIRTCLEEFFGPDYLSYPSIINEAEEETVDDKEDYSIEEFMTAQKLKDEVLNLAIDYSEWNESTPEEREELVRPAITEFVNKHREEFDEDPKVLEILEYELTDKNFHTEVKVMEEIYRGGKNNE